MISRDGPLIILLVVVGLCGACSGPTEKRPPVFPSPRAHEVRRRPSTQFRANAYLSRSAKPEEGRPLPKITALELDPIVGEYASERREMKDLRGDPRVTELVNCMRQLKDASATETDATRFQQLYDDAKFAMDVLLVHKSPRGNAALKFLIQIKLSLLSYDMYKKFREYERKGLTTVSETSIYLLLVAIPSIRKLGQRNSATGQLEFSMDDLICSLRETGAEQFDGAQMTLGQ